MEKNKIEISVRGRTYTLVSEQPKEVMQEASDLVNEQIKKIVRSASVHSSEAIMDLCAINLAGELISLKEQMKEAETRLEKEKGETNTLKRQLRRLQEQLRAEMAKNELKIDQEQ